jgi:hypothetical protein
MRGTCTGGLEGEWYINTPALSHIGVGEVDKKIIDNRIYFSYGGENGSGCGVGTMAATHVWC